MPWNGAPIPAHLHAAEDHITMLEMWAERERMRIENDNERRIRSPPNANTVICLLFPGAPPNMPQTMNAMLPLIASLELGLWPAEEATVNLEADFSLQSVWVGGQFGQVAHEGGWRR
uniref:Uncharacterized protein n=1 Tax=Mycena chlorophos TaxID=658473 RepID=A0ABQ0LT39_MYCCL|nr:predicted protein [Mycena chlorophos]